MRRFLNGSAMAMDPALLPSTVRNCYRRPRVFLVPAAPCGVAYLTLR